MRATLIYALTQIKRFFRDPVALFFTLLFPLLFLFVFGSIFRNDSPISFRVAIYNHSDTEFAREFVKGLEANDTFNINDDPGSIDDARELMGRNGLDSIIVLPEAFGAPNEQDLPSGALDVYYNEGSPQSGQTVAQVVDSILAATGEGISGQSPLFSVNQRATTTTNLTQFDYTVSGLLGFTILSLGIFGLANQIPAEKKSGSLRRIRATPFSKTQLIFGTMLYYGVLGAVSIIVMLVAAIGVFQFDMRGDWLQLALFLALSMVMMLGIGLLIGGCSKNENQAAVFSNIAALPLMFLSGAFFPRFLMPEWLQGITDFLPLTPIIDGIRYITTEGATLLDLGPQLLIIGAWIAVVYIAAIKLFRWE